MVTREKDARRIGTDNLVQRLSRRAAEQPADEALTFLVDGENERLTLTYGDLDRWARQIAVRIRDIVSEGGERVIILCPPGLDYVAAFYGTVYAGAVPVLFSPPRRNDRPETFRAVVAKMDPAIVLAPSATRAEMEASDVALEALASVPWIATDERVPGSEDRWREPTLADESIAYIMLTSGTTSVPKGTVWNHASVTTGLAQGEAMLSMVPSADLGSVTWAPLHHVGGLGPGVLMPIYLGYPSTLMSPAAFTERPLRWLEAVSRTRATAISAPTFAFDLCARQATEHDLERLDLSCVQSVMVGAEMVRPEILEGFAATFARCGFRAEAFNPVYGMTEGGISMGGKGIRVYAFSAQALQDNRVVPCGEEDDAVRLVGNGPIIPSVTVAFVDPKTLVRRDPGEVGELLVSGPTLATGYWGYEGDPDVNFNTYLPETGEGPFLRTGDLAFLHDNELFIAGRAKEVIIIRGRNLAPHALEVTAQQSHPSCEGHRSAAFSVTVAGDEALVIVQEVHSDAGEHHALMQAVRTSIATVHEIQPYAVVLTPPSTLPRTSLGKIQRRACRDAWVEGRLPVIAQQIGAGARSSLYFAPRTPTEEALARVWEGVLGIDRVGVEDNFFELGGDSLLSVQATVRARQAGVPFTPGQLLEHPTIAALAPLVGRTNPPAAEQGTVSGAAPLLPRQQLAFERTDRPKVESRHSLPVVVELPARAEPELAHWAVRAVVGHHDALRMRFRQENGRWEQMNAAEEEHDVFSFLDLAAIPAADRAEAMKKVIAEKQRSINLYQGPLVQAVLVRRDSNLLSLLILLLPHLITDAPSGPILSEDLLTAYRQLERGEAVTLPPKTTSLKAWAERLMIYARSPEGRKELDYWLSAFPASNPAPLSPHDAVGTSALGTDRMVEVELTSADTNVLARELPRVFGAQVNEAVIAALLRSFQAWTGSPSLLMNIVGHGRGPLFDDIDVSRTVGWLTIVFPVLLQLENRGTVEDDLMRVREKLRTVPNGGLGFGALRYLSDAPETTRELAALPVPEVEFNYQGYLDGADSVAAHHIGESGLLKDAAGREVHSAHRDIEIWARIQGGTLHLLFQFHREVYSRSSIERLASRTIEGLRHISAACSARDHGTMRT